jgi:hypothetical protein
MRDIRQRAASGVTELQDSAKEQAEHLSAGLGERAGNIAQAIRTAGESLQGKEDWLAAAANSLGRALEDMSAAAKEKGFNGIKRDAEQLARGRPAVFMGAAVVAGLALGRILRSSPPERRAGKGHDDAGNGSVGGGNDARPSTSPTYSKPAGGRDGAE